MPVQTPKQTATTDAQRERAMPATRAPDQAATVGPEQALAMAGRARGALGASAMLALQNAAGNRAVTGLVQVEQERSSTGDSTGAQAMGNRDEAQPRGERVDGDSAVRAGGPARLTGLTLPAGVSRPPRPLASAADSWQEVPHRAEMETAFGADFSHVKASLGRGPALDGMGARAATDGEHVVFAATQPSKQVIAHELAHVAQWQQAGGAGLAHSSLSGSNDPAEREADAAARAVAGGGSFRVSRTPSSSIHLVKAGSEKDVIERIMKLDKQIITRLGGVLEKLIPRRTIMLRSTTGRLAFLHVQLVEVKDPVTLDGDTLLVSPDADIDDDGVLQLLEDAVVTRAQAAFSSSPQHSAPTVTAEQTEDKASSNLNEEAPPLTPLTWIARHLPRQIVVHQQPVDVTISGAQIHLSWAQTNKPVTLGIEQHWMSISRGIEPFREGNGWQLRYSPLHDVDKWDPGYLRGALWYAFQNVHPLPAEPRSWEVAPPNTKKKDHDGMRAMPEQKDDGEWEEEHTPPSLDELFKARHRTQEEQNLVYPAVKEENNPIGHANEVIAGLHKEGVEAKLFRAINQRRAVLEEMMNMSQREDRSPASKQDRPSWSLLDNLEIEDQLELAHIERTQQILGQAWTKIQSMLEPQVMALVPPCTVHINGPNNPLTGGRRAEYDVARRCIHVELASSFDALFPFLVHEFTHHLEYYLPNSVWATVVGLLQHRSGGAKLQPPGGEHNRTYPEYKSSRGGPGGTDNYANLFYSDGGTEVLTRAIEYATREGIEGLLGDPQLCILLLRAFRPTLAQQIATECGLDLKIPPSMLAK